MHIGINMKSSGVHVCRIMETNLHQPCICVPPSDHCSCEVAPYIIYGPADAYKLRLRHLHNTVAQRILRSSQLVWSERRIK